MDLTTKNAANDLAIKLKTVYGFPKGTNLHIFTVLLATMIDQEKKIRTLEAQYESLSYRFLEHREQRRFDLNQ